MSNNALNSTQRRAVTWREYKNVLGTGLGVGDYRNDPRLLGPGHSPQAQWTWDETTHQCRPCVWGHPGQQACEGYASLPACQIAHGVPVNVDRQNATASWHYVPGQGVQPTQRENVFGLQTLQSPYASSGDMAARSNWPYRVCAHRYAALPH